MTALVATFLGSLLGIGAAGVCRPAWPRAAVVGAGLVIGPPLLALLRLPLVLAGLPAGLSSAALAIATLALAWVGLRRLRTLPAAPGTALGPALIAVLAACVVGATWLLAPSPDGDGIFLYGLKARHLHALGEVFATLRHPHMAMLNPAYPLALPLQMETGYLFAGDMSGLAALAPGLLVLPGLTLLLGSLAARRQVWSGWLVGLLVAFLPAFHTYATSGYADLALAAVAAVALLAALEGAPTLGLAGLATGLLPWIKHEGWVLAAIAGVAALVACRGRSPFWTRFLPPAVLLAAVWPLVLIAGGIQPDLGVVLDPRPLAERAPDVLRIFFEEATRADSILALTPLPILVACLLGLAAAGPDRRLSLMVLALLVVAIALPILRGSNPQHLMDGTAARLLLPSLPLGLLLVGRIFAGRVRRSAGTPVT